MVKGPVGKDGEAFESWVKYAAGFVAVLALGILGVVVWGFVQLIQWVTTLG